MLHFHQLLYALFCIKFRSSRAALWLDNKFIRLAFKKSSLKSDLKNILLHSKPITFEITPLRSKAITCASAVLVWLHVPNTWRVPAAGVPTQINTFEDKKDSCPCSLITGTHVADCWLHSRTLLELDYVFQESQQPQLKFFIPLKPDPMVKVEQLKFRAFFKIQPCN